MKQQKAPKNQSGKPQKYSSLRVSRETQRKLERVLTAANKKSFGRKVRADHVLSLVLDLFTDAHLEQLTEQSLTFEDRKELLRQKYIETRGPISKDEFIGFMMTDGFSDFMKEQKQRLETAPISA